MIKHPTDRADRLRLKRKYSLKHSRRKGSTDETNIPGRIDETTSKEDISIQADDSEQEPRAERALGLSRENAPL